MGTLIQGGIGAGYTLAETVNNAHTADVSTVDNNNDGNVDEVGGQILTADGVVPFDYQVSGNKEAVDMLNSMGLNEVVQAQGLDFPPAIRQQLGAISSKLSDFSATNLQGTQQQWAEFLTGLSSGGVPVDVNSLVQYVLREAYLDNTKDLQFYAQKVQFFNQLKDNMRKELTQARQMYSGMENGTISPTNTSQVQVGGANGIDPTKVTSGEPAQVQVGDYTLKVYASDPSCGGYPSIEVCRNGTTVCEVWGDPHISMGTSHDSSTMGKGANFWNGSNLVLPGGICIEMGTASKARSDGAYCLGDIKIHRGTDVVDINPGSNPSVVSPVSYDGGYSLSGKPTFIVDPDGATGQQLWLDAAGDGTADGLAYTTNYAAQQTVASAGNTASGTISNFEANFAANVAAATSTASADTTYNYYQKSFSMAMDPDTGKPYPPVTDTSKPITTAEDAKNYSDDLEEKLNSVGDDAQLANVDLQNMLQKQQQTLQMLSNISKMLNDTAMSVIRKIGG